MLKVLWYTINNNQVGGKVSQRKLHVINIFTLHLWDIYTIGSFVS